MGGGKVTLFPYLQAESMNMVYLPDSAPQEGREGKGGGGHYN